MSFKQQSGLIGLMLASSTIPHVAYSQVFMTEEQAVKTLFKDLKMNRKLVILAPEDIRQIEHMSDERVRSASITVWIGPKKEMLFVDEVLGKHEFITYAVAILNGQVTALEVLQYRETFGQAILKPEWRKQFLSKDASAPLKLNQDILNISGATLSCSHVTAGVRRVLKTYELLKARL